MDKKPKLFVSALDGRSIVHFIDGKLIRRSSTSLKKSRDTAYYFQRGSFRGNLRSLFNMSCELQSKNSKSFASTRLLIFHQTRD